MMKKCLLFLIILLSLQSNAQTCPSSNNEWEWATHTNWFYGRAKVAYFGTAGTVTPAVGTQGGASAPFTSYESCASASDEDGNLVVFTDGVNLWDGTGTQVAIPGGRLLTGAENATGNEGSAVQGVLIVKHPLNKEDYYIFTTDDALYGEAAGVTNGFNYFVYNKTTNTCSGGTRLGNYRSTEQIAATFHQNGFDIWIVSHSSTLHPTKTQTFNAYLLSCNGLEENPVTSNEGFEVKHKSGGGGYANERASLQFSWNDLSSQTIKAAATHHCGNGTWKPENSVSVLDFDILDGKFSNAQGLVDGTSASSNPYDCEFSPSGDRLFVTYQADGGVLAGRVGYFDLASGAYTQVGQTLNSIDLGSIKLGGDGNMYIGKFQKWPASWSYLSHNASISSPDGIASFTEDGLDAGGNNVGYGLPNMFIPPQDSLKIKDPGVLDECSVINLDCIWKCKGTDAEMTPSYEDAWSVKAGQLTSINSQTGEFIFPSSGTYKVYFEICSIKDSLEFTIGVCGCDVELGVTPAICVGLTVALDPLVLKNSGIGVWTIDSVPNTSGIDAVLIENLADTVFDASHLDTKSGVYKLILTVDNACKDSVYIEVKARPTIKITEFGPLCDDSVLTNVVAIPAIGGDVTAAYFSFNNALPQLSNVFDPAVFGPGTHSIRYGVDSLGCQNADSIKVIVYERPDPVITPVGPYCATDPEVTLTVVPDTGAWSGGGVNALGIFTPSSVAAGDHDITYTIGGVCGNTTTVKVKTTNKLDATITQVGPYCDSGDPVTLQVFDAGGIFSGDGVDPTTGVFTPKTAGVGIHTITYTITGNCGDVQTIDIEVIETLDPTITNTTFNFCEDHGDEFLAVTKSGGTWRELNTANGGFTAGTAFFNTVASGADVFKIEYGFGGQCPSADTITLNIQELPAITFPPQDTICVDATPIQIIATATPTTSTNWDGAVNATGIFDPVGKLGDNQVHYEVLNGVCKVDSTILVHVLKREDATINPVAKQCISSSAVALVSTSGNTTGIWSGKGVLDDMGFVFNPTLAEEGKHIITHEIAGRCGDTATIEVEVVGIPNPVITPPEPVCAGSEQFTLSTATSGGIWSGDINSDGTFDPIRGGVFKAIYTILELCPVADTIEFNVKTIPLTDFINTPRSGCIPLTSVFTDLSKEVPVQSSWDFGNNQTSNDALTTSQTYNTVGCYDATLTNLYANECTSSKILPDAVCTFGIPSPDFSWNPNPADVDNATITFNNLSSSDAISFSWDFTDVILPAESSPITTADPSLSNDINPMVNFTSANGDKINVCVVVANQNGCINDTCKIITINDKFSVIVANAFTPNDDGINDTFFPQGRNLEFGSDYEFRIYDRWGALIWKSKTPYEGWDGTVAEIAPSSGDVAQIDVYVWRLVVSDPFTGDKHELIGHVSLIK